MSQAELARRVGITQPSINHLVKRGAAGSAHLHKIARVLVTTPEYLSGETDDDSPGAGVPDRSSKPRDDEPKAADSDAIAWIKQADLTLGMGGSYLEGPVEEKLIPFPADWLSNYSPAAQRFLVFVRGKGTSMEPTIFDGNLCLLDLSRTVVDEQDELWACAYGNIGMIKRLRAMPDGSIKIMSDADGVRDETAGDGELHIIARCVGVFRRT
ncbi:MAG: helix-turn-helix transcriptional regulator [Novosphingobium sp.]|nr:helix-turn-helix transcriptional regulator [Novosphingobium sp.]